MTFKPNLSVKESLDHLATCLDPIIERRLAPKLDGLPWTTVLEILDEKKGFANTYRHWTYDLQSQLRMLTERLGDFGYPFDDSNRTVSTLGNELRIVRKQSAHMHDFSIEEAFRVGDFCVRLLEHFNDSDGLAEARRIRREALAELAVDSGISQPPPALVSAPPLKAIAHPGSEERTQGLELVRPDPRVLVRQPSAIGAMRLEFEPWNVVQVGTIDVLDDLPKKAAKDKVRAVALEIAAYEGPVHLERLVAKTAESFGLQRLSASRSKRIAYQVRQAGLFIDSDKFAWPREIDPASWNEFRPNDSDVDRPFIHISPVEIANAARFIRSQQPALTHDELASSVLQTFGRQRRTKQFNAHLERAERLL